MVKVLLRVGSKYNSSELFEGKRVKTCNEAQGRDQLNLNESEERLGEK